jgi:mannose-6-phosphate isomerase-like protein (cupin superfamily)
MAKTLALPKDQLVKQALVQMQNTLADNTWTDRQKLALTCRILFENGHDSGLAGQITDKTFKEHLGEEFLFVHEGQVEVDFMNERVILERGDALHFNAQKPHRLRSVGDVQAQLLVVVHSAED